MTALEQLNAYLRKLELRMRLLAATRGAAIIAGSAVLLTALLAWICNKFAFAGNIVFPVRIVLYLSVAAAIVFGLVIPLLRLNRRWIARRAERQMGDFKERLLTITERSDPANPFTELLAEDALEVARMHDASELAPGVTVWGLVASAMIALGILIWMIFAAPGYWGYGSSLLWAGAPRAVGPLYDIVVHPGNRTVRRKSDQLVTADLIGFSSDKVTLYARYQGALQWNQLAMQPQRDGNGYEFLFAGLSDPVDYYVSTNLMKSKTFHIGVKDLPVVKQLRVTVHYPAYLKLKDNVTGPSGDVRALQGSHAEVAVQTDRPLDHGLLVMEDGRKLNLSRGANQGPGNWLTAQFDVAKDGSYHVAALDNGDAIRLSDDYFIEAQKDSAPNVKIINPAHDPHVSPIEELPITVASSDDFGLKNVELHYSVNGGPEKTINLTKRAGEKQTEAKTTLSFEDFKAVPGDLVSFYATASDAKTTSRTDLLFAQAEPFDLRFKQSQQAGGGGGGAGNESGDISQRQKEIIAATWNELKNGSTESNSAAEEAKFLSEVEGKLGAQAKTLADRMRSRELSGNNAEFEEFSKQMDRASAEMGNAVGELKGRAWRNALSPEQRALQALTRAESLFKDIQIAYGRMNGGSMGNSGSAGRDLARMFDLELDTEKNQYETGESASMQSEQQKQLQDALERLKQLARRQQDLAAQRQAQQASQQRWEQEMLRREAEQLQQRMQQLSQNQQQGQNGQQSSSQGGSQSASVSGSRSSRARNQAGAGNQAMNRQLEQAMNDLRRAQDEMRNAVSRGDASAQQRAAADLRSAQEQLQQMQSHQAQNSVSELAQQAQNMLDKQKDFSNRLRQAASEQRNDGSANALRRRFGYGGRWNRDPYDPSRQSLPGNTSPQMDRLANEKQQMAEQLEQLQREVQRQAQNLAGDDPQLSSKLRDAVSSLQQQDLASHMKKDSDWIRDGYAAQTWVNEQGATLALDHFNQQMQQAQQLAQNAKRGNGQPKPGDDTQRALQQLEQLRQQLSRATRPGNQGGQPGSSSSDSPAEQDFRGGGMLPGGNPAIAEAMQNMASLRRQLAPRGSRAYYDSEYAFRFLNDLQGADPSELAARLNREVLPALQRLEVDLKREAKTPPGAGRIAAPEPAPDKYSDAIAEYFKKLSQ
jgi:hypothetical protein